MFSVGIIPISTDGYSEDFEIHRTNAYMPLTMGFFELPPNGSEKGEKTKPRKKES